MDSFSLRILFLVCGFLLSFVMSIFFSTLLVAATEKQYRFAAGYSAEASGAVLWVLIGAGIYLAAVLQFWAQPVLVWFLIFLYVVFALFFGFTVGHISARKTYHTLSFLLFPLCKVLGGTIGLLFSLPSLLLVRFSGPKKEADMTEEDVLSLVDSAEQQDVIDETQKEMIENIFELDDITAGDAMTHRTDVIAVSEDVPAIDVVRLAMEEGISRMPVYRKTLDDILGIIYVKDLFLLLEQPENREKPATDFMRAVMYVPEACRARELIREFKKKHTQIAIVVDEYGGTSGLVTMEDVLEEIVGDMQDEFDDEKEMIVDAGNETYLCDGLCDLEDVFSLFHLLVPKENEDGDFDSIGGLITQQIGRIPDVGEQLEIRYGGLCLKVMEVGERRILKVLCSCDNEGVE